MRESEEQQTGAEPAAEQAPPEVPAHLGRDLALYALSRFALVSVVAVALVLVHVPLLIAIAVGVVAGLPLSMVLLRGWHARIARGLAARGLVRRAARDRLRAELRGDDPDAVPGSPA